MKVCILGPVMTEGLLEWIKSADRHKAMQTPGMGGSSVTNLVRARLRRKQQTELITFCPQAHEVQLFEGDHLKYWVCPRSYQMGARSGYKQARKIIGAIFNECDADLFHAHWTYDYAMALMTSGRKGLVTVRDHVRHILPLNGITFLPAYIWTQYIFRRHSFFSAVSPYVAGYVEQCTGQPVPVISNNVDMEWLPTAQPAFHNKRITVASASSWAPFKNVKNTLRAFALFRSRQKDASLVLMGPGLEHDGPAYLWAVHRGLDHDVMFLGRCPYRRVLDEFSAADIILHSSLEESFGNPLLEGMALERVVIAGRQTGGCPWVLDHGKAGMLVDVRYPDEMAEAMLKSVHDKSMRAEMTVHGRELMKTRYHSDTVLTQYHNLYEKILLT